MNLTDAKVIITGSTSGIGYETAKALISKGAEVIITGRNKDKLEKAKSELKTAGYLANVTEENDVKALFKYGIEKMGSVNVLINNAGFGGFSSLVDTTLADFESQWAVNTKGLFLAGREAAKHFVENKYGNIINIGSTAALKGFASGSSYVASKFAVSGLTECWQAELRTHNVRVMQVNPSEVVTEFFEKAGLEARETDHKLKPSEIAHLIVSMLEMNDIGFIPNAAVWATNPWVK